MQIGQRTQWTGDQPQVLLFFLFPILSLGVPKSSLLLLVLPLKLNIELWLTQPLVWIIQLLFELHIPVSAPPILRCDNRSAMAIASNHVFHARTKHIEIAYHYIREQVLAKTLDVQFVGSTTQLADIFTKGLPISRFLFSRGKLMVGAPPISLKGDVKE